MKSPKKKKTIKRSSRTPLQIMGSNRILTLAKNKGSSNREIVIKENVIGVMEQVRNAKKTRELSKNEAQKLVNHAMKSNN